MEPIGTEWLTLGQASRRLVMSPESVRRFRQTGQIRFVMTPLGMLYCAEDIEALVQQRAARQAGAETPALAGR